MKRVILLGYFNNGYIREVLSGVLGYAQALGDWEVKMEDESWRGPDRLERLAACDGLIHCISPEHVLLDYLVERVPVVGASIFGYQTPYPSVAPDWRLLGAMAAEFYESMNYRHLLPLCRGHRCREAFLAGIEEAVSGDVEILPAAGMGGGTQPTELARQCPARTGVIAMAQPLGFMEAVREAGRRIPEEIALLGVHDDPIAGLTVVPGLSYIAVPAARIGHLAAEALAQYMGGRQPASRTVEPIGVVEHGSTLSAGTDDPLVQAAMRFIRSKAGETIDAEAVAAAMGVSRCTLDRRFRLALGHTPSDYLLETRIRQARQLLATTLLPIVTIAERCGGMSRDRFGRVFRKATGLSPSAFRRRHRGVE